MTFYISISEVYVHFIPVFPHTHTKSYEPHTRSSGGLVFFWGDVIMSCWFSCFYATLLPWPRAVIKQQAYKKTIAPVHFRRLCQGFNSEINSEETSWWLLRSHSWLDESVSIICLSVVTLCCSRSHLWPMLMWSRTGAITDEVNSWTGIKVLYESSIWFIASTEEGVGGYYCPWILMGIKFDLDSQ